MASKIDICNLALQKLGARRISSLSQDSANARSCAIAYDPVLENELRSRNWNFAKKYVTLAADASPPDGDYVRGLSFTLPTDYLRLIPPYPEYNHAGIDYSVEGRKLYTNLGSPLSLRYIAKVTDTTKMDASFVDVFACALAFQMVEEITQSNSKKESLRLDYKEALIRAAKANAFEMVSQGYPDDTWVTVRR